MGSESEKEKEQGFSGAGGWAWLSRCGKKICTGAYNDHFSPVSHRVKDGILCMAWTVMANGETPYAVDFGTTMRV